MKKIIEVSICLIVALALTATTLVGCGVQSRVIESIGTGQTGSGAEKTGVSTEGTKGISDGVIVISYAAPPGGFDRPGDSGGNTTGVTSIDHIDIGVDLSATAMINGVLETVEFEITTDDAQYVTITANPTDTQFSTSGGISTSTDNAGKDQIRIEGGFPIGTQDDPVYYTVTLSKTIETASGVSIPVTLYTTMQYWDGGNVCPGYSVTPGNQSGIDLTLGNGSVKGSIFIQKTLDGVTPEQDQTFNFVLLNTDRELYMQDISITVPAGQTTASIFLTNLDFGTYIIEEVNPINQIDGYELITVEYANEGFLTISESNPNAAISVINYYELPSPIIPSHTPVYGGTEDVHTKCSTCGTTLSSTHSFTSKVETAATCTTEGTIRYTCDCGYNYTEDIPALDHNYDSVVTEPSCAENGYTTHTCSRCEDSYKDTWTTIPTEPTAPEVTDPTEPTEPSEPTTPVAPTGPQETSPSEPSAPTFGDVTLSVKIQNAVIKKDTVYFLNLYNESDELVAENIEVEVKAGSTEGTATLTSIPFGHYRFSVNTTKTKLEGLKLNGTTYSNMGVVTLSEDSSSAHVVATMQYAKEPEIVVSEDEWHFVIPETINGEQFTKIEANAFRGLTKLTSVTIPETVTEIGDNAFADCPNLTTITFVGRSSTYGMTLGSNWNSSATLVFTEDADDEYTGEDSTSPTDPSFPVEIEPSEPPVPDETEPSVPEPEDSTESVEPTSPDDEHEEDSGMTSDSETKNNKENENPKTSDSFSLHIAVVGIALPFTMLVVLKKRLDKERIEQMYNDWFNEP